MKKPILYSIMLAVGLPVAGFASDPGPTSSPLNRPIGGFERVPAKSADEVKIPNPAGIQHPFSGAIMEVNRDEKTITIQDSSDTKLSQKLHVGETTKMKRGNKDATWDDLKVGAIVDGISSGDEESRHVETLNIKS